MKKVDISFITINYNSSGFTIELIKSIKRHTSLSYEIIVVDNASEKEDLQTLEEFVLKEKSIKLLKNRINAGFASGNMLGVNAASGEYYFFINNDTQLLNDAGAILKQYLDTHENVALATAKVSDENGRYTSTHKIFPSVTKELFGNSVARMFNKFPSNKTKLETPTTVEVVSGSCMFFRASVFCRIGGFDTIFFLYCEEEDIAKRVWLAGYEVCFLPEAKIIHHSGGSTQKSLAILKEYYISYKHLIFKHFDLPRANLLMLLVTLKLLRRSFKSKRAIHLLLFALRGFPKKESLRYEQKVSEC